MSGAVREARDRARDAREALSSAPVPEITVTPPEEERGDRTPWYMERGATGQVVVADSVKSVPFSPAEAGLWARRTSRSLTLPSAGAGGRGTDRLRSGIREAVRELLLTKEPRWDDLLAVGRMALSDGRLVWLRPVIRDLSELPPGEEQDTREYPVAFSSTKVGGETSHGAVQGVDTILFTGVNLGLGAAAAIAGVAAPQVQVASETEQRSGWSRTVLSGRKPFVNAFGDFASGLGIRVFVDGEEVTPPDHRRVVVPGRLRLRLPDAFTAQNPPRPLPYAPDAMPPARPAASGPSQAREMLNAVDMTPVIAGLHRSLRKSGLPAQAVLHFMNGLRMDRRHGFLSEPTARNRYTWWSSEDVSRPVEVGGGALLRRGFRAHVRLHAEIDSLQYVGDTDIASRDDYGAGTNRTSADKHASTGGLGAGYTTLGVGNADTGSGGHAGDEDGPEAGGLVPAANALLSSRRGNGLSLDAGHLSHTVLNIFGNQSRYAAGLRLTATVESSTRRVEPVNVTTVAELSVPEREAAAFVGRTVGREWTADLRPVADGPAGRRHRVFVPPRRLVRELPVRTSRSRLAPPPGTGRPRTPHPREPLALAARRGFGPGMPIALPGIETLQADIRAALLHHQEATAGARRAAGADWAAADSELAAFYGRAAVEADLYQALLGIHRRIEVGGRTYKVSAKLSWGGRIGGSNPLTGPVNPESNPSGATYRMRINSRVVSGATVTGERARRIKGRMAFGGGAVVTVPERGIDLGGRRYTLPELRFQLATLRVVAGASRERSVRFKGLAKSYRRTETGGKADEHRYRMTMRWTVTPQAVPSRDGGRSRDGREIHYGGRVRAVARIAVPQEHAPHRPMTRTQAERAGRVHITSERPVTDRSLDFGTGTHGLYPTFHMMPELARLAARMYAAQHRPPRDGPDDDPADWPGEIQDLAHPVVLASRFDEMTGRFGYEFPLPGDGEQGFRVRLLIHASVPLGSSDKVEVEHYLQGAASFAAEKRREWTAGVDGTVGPFMPLLPVPAPGGSDAGRLAVPAVGRRRTDHGAGGRAHRGRSPWECSVVDSGHTDRSVAVGRDVGM